MNTTNKLLDKYAEICSARTDSELAAKLHVTKSAVSNWRREKAHPDESSIEKMAEAIGEPVGPWLIAIQADRTHETKNRKVWLRHAATLGVAVALAVAVLPSRVHAMTTQPAMRKGSVQFDISQNRHSRTFIRAQAQA